MFVETHNFQAMLAQVRSQSYVTFVGVPGSGKTATARHIALKLREEGYEILSIKIISDVDTYCNPNNPQVFVIDDILGRYGLEVETYNLLNKYENTLKEPKMSKTKVLMTCRELVYRYEMLSECFLCKQDNVVLLHSEEYALNDMDIRELLAKYQLGSDFLSSSEKKSLSKMFPFLCKLYSSKKGLKLYGSKFFISPVPWILDELQNMRRHAMKNYVSLVLLMANESRLSEDILNNITNDIDEVNLNEKKRKFLEACKVNPNMAYFEIIDALSEMEGTYTKKCGITYTFVHDSMFEIVAYHFGRQFPELMLQYMNSDYVAHYIKLESSDKEDKEYKGGKTGDDKEYKEIATEKESVIDLCLKLQKSQHNTLAVRLFRDVENGEFFNVFGNGALKHKSVRGAFIEVMMGKTYTELHKVFLSEIKEKFNSYHYINPKTESVMRNYLGMIDEMLINTRFKIYNETSLRAISWVIYHGHHQILHYITDRTIEENSNTNALFQNSYNKDDIRNIIESQVYNVIPSKKNTDNVNNNVSNNFITICKRESVAMYCRAEDSEHKACRRNNSMAGGNTWIESETDIYSEPVIVEQNRLLCLGCYSGDLNTVSILLKHVNGSAINITKMWLNRSYSKLDPLSIACSLGYLDIATKLITAGANVNQKYYARSPLICACENGHKSVVEKLINEGANVNVHKGDRSPLEIALYNKNSELVQILIKAGSDVDHIEKEFSLLTAACLHGHRDIVETLIKARADVNLIHGNYTPLTAACCYGHLDIVEELIKARADVNLKHGKYTPLTATCLNGYLDIVVPLIEAGADVNLQHWNCTPLTAACLNGNLDIVKKLIVKEADVNQNNGQDTPLSEACRKGDFAIVEQLIEAGADVNSKNERHSPLGIACNKVKLNIVRILIKAGADVNVIEQNFSLLTAACFNGNFIIVRRLIKAGANVNLKHGSYTPLTAACRKGDLAIVKTLVSAGADVNLNHGKYSPLSAAYYYRHLDIVNELLSKGAYKNAKDISILIAACANGYLDIVQELIGAGADVNLRHGDYTPLTVACLNGHLNIVRELIKIRSCVNLRQGKYTPLTAAIREGRISIVEILIDADADVNLQDSDRSPLGIAFFEKYYESSTIDQSRSRR